MKELDLSLADTIPAIFSDDETHEFRLRTGWIDDIGIITPGQTYIEKRPLSWWEGHELIYASDPSWGADVAAWVYTSEEKLVRLDGTSPPIHDLNAKVEPMFTRENVTAYLGFFCQFVHGDNGPFYIVHDINAGLIPSKLSEKDRAKIEHVFRAPDLLKIEESKDGKANSVYHVECLVYYSHSVFLGNFKIDHSGLPDLFSEEQLVTDLGHKIEMGLKFKEKEELDIQEAEGAVVS